MQIGIVKWFNAELGYGFLQHDDGRDVFVHHTVIEMRGFRTLVQHDVVEYELTEGPKALLATRVRPLRQVQDPVRQGLECVAGSTASP